MQDVVAVAVVYYVTARVGQLLAIPPGNVTPVWLSSGIVLAVVLLRGYHVWPGIFLGAFAGNAWAHLDLTSSSTIAASILVGAANGTGEVLCVLLSAALINRTIPSPGWLRRVRDLMKFVAYGAPLGPLVSATFGITSLCLAGFVPWDQYTHSLITWWAGDAVGVLILTPVILAWATERRRPRFSMEWLAFVLVLAVASVHCLGVLPSRPGVVPPLSELAPILLWGAFRLGRRVTYTAVLVVAALAIMATAAGHGPFAGKALNQSLIDLQLFIAVMAVTMFALEIVVAERGRAVVALNELNEELEQRVKERTARLQVELTDRRRAEREVRELAKFPAVDPNPVLRIARDGTIVYANPASRALLQTWERSVGEPVPERWGELVRAVLDGGSNREEEVTYQGRIALLTLTPVVDDDCVNAYGLDITVRKQAEQASRRSGAFLDSIFEQSPYATWISDDRGTLIRQNQACRQLLRIDDDDVVGKYNVLEDNIVKEHGVMPLVRSVFEEGRTARFNLEYDSAQLRNPRVKKTVSLVLDVTMSPVKDASGKITNAIIQHVDITERRRAEQERRQMEAQLRHSQKLESLGILAGGIAHDFNNLLVGILGNASLVLADLPEDASLRESLEMIEASAVRAAELTNQMLAYSGRGTFVVNPLDLSELVRDVAHLVEPGISKKVTVSHVFAEELPAIEADAAQIRQVVMNLITNASEAIGDVPGTIAISTGVVELGPGDLEEGHLGDDLPAGRYVYVQVSDTGCGMGEETKAKIFDPFFTTKFTGRGLGLAVVLGIVRGHRGAIQIETKPGKGTTFRALLPASEKTVRTDSERDRPPLAAHHRGDTVLVVDDEEQVLRLARTALERAGFAVLTAGDGHTALRVFREHADETAAVLLDLTMPGLDGEEALDAIHRVRADVPVILSSGYTEQEASDRFLGKGLAGFLQKPYRASALTARIHEAIEKARAASPRTISTTPR